MSDPNQIPPINADDIQKVNEYTKAFDNLRNSVKDLSNPIANLDKGISRLTDSIDKLNNQNQIAASSGNPVIDTIDKISKASSAAGSVINGFKNALKILEAGAISLEGALTGGLTILIAFAPEIIKWVGEMMKGNTTLSALGQAMKNNTSVAEALIQTKLKGAQAAQGEITDLKVLYNATQNHTLSLKQKKEAANALKEQWPGTFKNISDETIIAGKAANAYKSLKDQIIATAYAEAAKNKITANANRALENNEKIAKERTKNLEIVVAQKKMQDSYDKQLDYRKTHLINDEGASDSGFGTSLDKIARQRVISDKLIFDLSTDTQLLNMQSDGLEKEIEKKIKVFGANITTNKSTVSSIFPQKKQHKSKPDNQRDPAKNLQAMALDFNKTIELEKKNYDTEQALLDDLLSKKLISQEKYQQKSAQLSITFHQGIEGNIDEFKKVNLANAQKNLQDMINANQHEDLMRKDQQNVDKAILPGNKLEAEKKQINDKYAYEIALAGDSADKIKQIKEENLKDLTELNKKYEQDRENLEFETAKKVSDAAFSILQNSLKSQSDNKVKQLETQKEAELSNTTLTATQKQAIEDKYKKKEAEEKVKAFKDEQKASILQAVINGALAVTKATAQSGVLSPFVIPGIIAETAIQIATIAAQKPPQYAKGGMHYKSDGKGAMLSGYSRTDNTNAHLRSGEAVVVSEAMRDPWAHNLVSAINVAYGGRDFSTTNQGRGYAIGGIFTDGGNSNRYYNQPMNDQKDLANTIAYQMINNFPPVYVDVKDVNNQQNILAQTVNRVNL